MAHSTLRVINTLILLMKNIFEKFKPFLKKHRAIKSFCKHSKLGILEINNISNFLHRNHCREITNLCLNTSSDRQKFSHGSLIQLSTHHNLPGT